MFEKIKNSPSRCHIFIGTDLKQVKDVLDSIYLSDKTGNVIYVQSTRDLTSARIGTESVYIQCIDAFLSPTKQRTIIQELYAMYPKAKIICGTNSPFIVNSVDDAWVYEISEENYEEIDGIKILEGRLTNPFDGYQNILINQFNCGIVEFDKTGGELGEELFDLIRSKTVTPRLKELVGLVRQSSNRFLISKLEMLLLDYKIDL